MTLQETIDKYSEKIGTTYGGSSYNAIHHIIRSIDYILPLYTKSNELKEYEIDAFREFFIFGWVGLLKKYYDEIDINIFEPFTLMNDELTEWAYSNILFSGKIEFCKQLIAYEKAGLIKIVKTKDNEFTFEYLLKNTGIERYDVQSYNFYTEKIVEQLISEKKKKKFFNEKKIKEELKKIIRSPDGRLISYVTTPEIDEYYAMEGHYHVLRLQGYDEFDKYDQFGGIEYWKYIDLIELVVGVALKHLDACLELKKMNNNVNLDRTDKVNHSQRMKVSIVKQVLKIDSSEYKFNNYFLIFCA